jgi:hypothetical protein
LQRLWRGYAAVVGLIIIVAVSTGDRGGSAIIAGGTVVSTRSGGTDRSGADGGSTDADRHARAVNATTVSATTVNATMVNATMVSATTNATCTNSTGANSTTAKCRRLVRNGQHKPDSEDGGGSECHNGST